MTSWPAYNVERRSVSSLVPYSKNSRVHSASQIEQIAKAVKTWGWTIPVLVDSHGEIIAGHGRILAAQKLGIEEVPVIVAKGWTDEQKRAYRIADNKLVLNSSWDIGFLAEELSDLRGLEFNIEAIGFSKQELDALVSGLSAIDNYTPHNEEAPRLGSSPWERMSKPVAEGVLFQFGSICCRLPQGLYDEFTERVPESDIAQWLAEILSA